MQFGTNVKRLLLFEDVKCKFLKNISGDIVEISPYGDYVKLCEKYGAEYVNVIGSYCLRMSE